MKKIGITLSGGGMTAAAHLGVLKAMHEFGIYPEIVSGTSMGSIIAGLYACNIELDEIFKLFYTTNKSVFDIDYSGILKSLFSRQLPSGLIKGNKLEKKIDALLGGIKIIDVSKKLGIVSTNINGGENVIFTNNDTIEITENRIYINDIALSKAIRASICFPFVFTPVIIDDLVLLDGGIVNNCPVNLCQEMGADFIFVSSAAEYRGQKLDSHCLTDITGQMISIMIKEANQNDYGQVTVPQIRIPLFSLKKIPLLALSKDNVNKVAAAGYEDTCNLLDSLDNEDLDNLIN
mgnify:CR=1 FL=1